MTTTEHFGAEVRATLTDERVLNAKVARPLGRGPENPLPVELLEAKLWLPSYMAVTVVDPAGRLRVVNVATP